MKNEADPSELAARVSETESICREFLAALSFVVHDTARDGEYINNHLLSYTAQDYVQSIFALPLLVRQGIHNVCKREVRFLLEMSIKLCFIQQSDYRSPIETKVKNFAKVLESTNISLQKRIDLSMLPEGERVSFYGEVGRLYGETSEYVHWTSAQILDTIAAIDERHSVGSQAPESVHALNRLIERVLACSLVFLYHAVPAYVAGDWLVDAGGSSHSWHFQKSRFIAFLDQHHDYKAERRDNLTAVQELRWRRVEF